MAKTTLYKCGDLPGQHGNPYYGIAPASTDLSPYFKEPGFSIIRTFDSEREAVAYADARGWEFPPNTDYDQYR